MSTVLDLLETLELRVEVPKNVYPALNKAIRLVAKRLRYHQSDIITSSYSLSYAADASTASLPSDFWGLTGKPYEDGKSYPLKPLPDKDYKLVWDSSSIARWYRVINTTLEIIPPTASAITVKGDYFQRPTAMSKIDDTLPYNELFDDAIEEYLVGAIGGKPDPMIIQQAVDDTIVNHDRSAPDQLEDDMNWDSMYDG